MNSFFHPKLILKFICNIYCLLILYKLLDLGDYVQCVLMPVFSFCTIGILHTQICMYCMYFCFLLYIYLFTYFTSNPMIMLILNI